MFDPSRRSHKYGDVSQLPHECGAHLAPSRRPQQHGSRLALAKCCFVHPLQPLQATISPNSRVTIKKKRNGSLHGPIYIAGSIRVNRNILLLLHWGHVFPLGEL